MPLSDSCGCALQHKLQVKSETPGQAVYAALETGFVHTALWITVLMVCVRKMHDDFRVTRAALLQCRSAAQKSF
jgi:hypothetical protein